LEQTADVSHLHLSRACYRLCCPDDALRHARLAREQCESACDAVAALECAVEEVAALSLKEDPRAPELARRALKSCLALEGALTPCALCWMLTRLGHVFIAYHDWLQGVRLLQAAADVEADAGDAGQTALILADLSAALLALDQVDGAIALGQRTLDACSAAGGPIVSVQAHGSVGVALLRAGRYPQAARHLARSLDTCERLDLRFRRGEALVNLVELHAARRDRTRAARCAAEAAAAAARVRQPMTCAAAMQWLGWLVEREGDPRRADRCFQRALGLLSPPGAAHRRIACHAWYAEVLEARGDVRAALTHYRHAAQLAHARPTRSVLPDGGDARAAPRPAERPRPARPLGPWPARPRARPALRG